MPPRFASTPSLNEMMSAYQKGYMVIKTMIIINKYKKESKISSPGPFLYLTTAIPPYRNDEPVSLSDNLFDPSKSNKEITDLVKPTAVAYEKRPC